MQRKSHKNKKYSAELKLTAVIDYLNGGGSQREICQKYGIVHMRQLYDWIIERIVLAELINNGDFERHINRVRREKRKELMAKS